MTVKVQRSVLIKSQQFMFYRFQIMKGRGSVEQQGVVAHRVLL